jgi:hypothetical protein
MTLMMGKETCGLRLISYDNSWNGERFYLAPDFELLM